MDAAAGGIGSGQLFSVDPLGRRAARGHDAVTSMAAGSDVIVLGTSLVRHDYTFEDARPQQVSPPHFPYAPSPLSRRRVTSLAAFLSTSCGSRRCKDLQLMNENMEVLQSLKLVSAENENSNKGASVLFVVHE